MKPVTLEDSQVRLPLQIAQLDAERKISITHHKQKFSFPKLIIYAGLSIIHQRHVEIFFFIHLHLISYLIWLNGTSSVISPCTSSDCVPVSLYWARHWPRPKLYAELGGCMFIKLAACRNYHRSQTWYHP